MFDTIQFGPLGDAIDGVMPQTEADPIGIYASALSLFSAAINGHVRGDRGRPVSVWTVLAGPSGLGCKGTAYSNARALMGPAFAGFFASRLVSGISSGPSLVSNLYGIELASLGGEDGPDGRALIVEEEWGEVLKRAKRCPTFDQKLRTAWDGSEIANRTKGKNGTGEVQKVEAPLLGFHAHITPAEWHALISPTAALGGSYNRILPVTVEQSKMIPYGQNSAIRADKRIAEAYRWAKEKPRVVALAKEAYRPFDEIRSFMAGKMASTPPHHAVYFERTAEQVLRVATVLAASEMKTKISKQALLAAWSFVQYSINSVEKLLTSEVPGSKPKVKALPDMIRELLRRHGGEATSTLLLRSLQARTNAAGLRETVDQLDDVEYYKGKSAGVGAKPTMYRLIDSKESTPRQVAEQRPVLKLVEPSVKRKTRPAPAPSRTEMPTVRSASTAQSAAAPVNPFAALL
ncbi:DUF3987 domain-containing protein [Streptomyces sp. NPDC000594]|uniref:DUF3987 domain-containing protein n=1 Tax=Streptomyces sp. NPDC000594 TaxID=3154261 RepID=UPI00332EDFB3